MDAEFVNAPKTYVIKGKKHIASDATNVDNAPDLPASTYTDLLKEYGSDALNYLKEHPGELAANVALAANPEISIPSALAANLGGYMLDSMHPFTAQEADYKTQSPMGYIGTGLMAGILGAIPGGEGKALSKDIEREGQAAFKGFPPPPDIDPITYRGKMGNIGTIPPSPDIESIYLNPNAPRYVDASTIGGYPGYNILNYTPEEQAIQKSMEQQGIKRFIPASQLGVGANGFDPEKMLGNPLYMTSPKTPEGADFLAKRSLASQEIPDILYSGSSSSPRYDPFTITRPMDIPKGKMFTANAQYGLYPTEKGQVIKPKWLDDQLENAETYAPPFSPYDSRDYVFNKIDNGSYNENNYPGKDTRFASFQDFKDWLYNRKTDQFDIHDLIKDEPQLQRHINSYVPFFENPKIYDKMGGNWTMPDFNYPAKPYEGPVEYQARQIKDAINNGNDVVVWRNTIDPGGGITSPRGLISNVYTSPIISKLKYPFNYGTWNLNDVRPLAAIPLAAGLGAYFGTNDNQ